MVGMTKRTLHRGQQEIKIHIALLHMSARLHHRSLCWVLHGNLPSLLNFHQDSLTQGRTFDVQRRNRAGAWSRDILQRLRKRGYGILQNNDDF